MELDTFGRRSLFWSIPLFLLVFLFLPFSWGMKILFFSTFLFFLIVFFLCAGWAKPKHPERHLVIGFLVSIFHTFLFILGGAIGLFLALLVLKISSILLIYLKEILRF